MVRAFVLLLLLLGTAAPAWAGAQRPPCSKVISAVNREVSRRHGAPASPRAVARSLNAEPGWVRRCMDAYGRTASRRDRASAEEREELEHAREEGRSVIVGADEQEELWAEQHRQRQERQEIRRQERQTKQNRELWERSSDPFFPIEGLGGY